MAKNEIGDNRKRDAVIQETGGSASPKRADLLNGSPRTKSIGGGGPNFRGKDDQKDSFPVPSSPYGRGE